MSTVIIIGGDDARKAIATLESMSLKMTDSERVMSEALLRFVNLFTAVMAANKQQK